jgi:hypothetical protein
MNTPNITANDIGNGNNMEIVRLIPKDIPSHTNWLVRNCLLLLMLKFDSHLIFLAYGYLKKFPNCVHIIFVNEANDPNFNTQRYSPFLLREENLNDFMIRSAWACNTSNPIDAEGEWLTDRSLNKSSILMSVKEGKKVEVRWKKGVVWTTKDAMDRGKVGRKI